MSVKSEMLQVPITWMPYERWLELIENSIRGQHRISVTYAHYYTLNLVQRNQALLQCLQSFDYIHPDGIALYLAAGLLDSSLQKTRMTGSDFYQLLLPVLQSKQYRVFFLGDTAATVDALLTRNKQLNIAGAQDGFTPADNELITKINRLGVDILFVGMGTPKQEFWIQQNRNQLQVPVVIAVGEGLRVFAGTKKRGPWWIQKCGLEWLVRLLNQPGRLWKRYFIGIPVFTWYILKQKLF